VLFLTLAIAAAVACLAPAAAATVPHLAAKLASAFNAALSTAADKRRKLIADALARRFVVEDQMQAYQKMWRKIDAASAAVSASKQQNRAAAGSNETDTYFAQSWQRRNLNLQAALVASAPPAAGTCNVMVTKISESGSSSKSSSGGLFGQLSSSFIHKPQQQKKKTQQDEEVTPRHVFSNYLIMLLQSMSMLPSLLLLAYMVLQQISRQTWSTCPLRPDDKEWLPILNTLGMRVLWQLILSTAAAPIWTWLAFKKTPK
jgi:hypothetical protein